MNDRSRPYIAFLVRIWQVGATDVWRASATDPHTGEQRLFADLEALFAFIGAETSVSGIQTWQSGLDDTARGSTSMQHDWGTSQD